MLRRVFVFAAKGANDMVSMAVVFLFGVLVGFGCGYLMAKSGRRPDGWRGEEDM